MTKRERDAFIRNRHPLEQTTIPPLIQKNELKKGLKVRLLYNADDINDTELARLAMATLERWGYLCEMVKDESSTKNCN